MQLGMIGLGRMGANMTRRLIRAGHEVVVSDTDPDAVSELASEGGTASSGLDELVAKLQPPRAVWLMVPAAVVGSLVDQLADKLDNGDVIIDGGNSHWRDDVDRAAQLAPKGIHYVDVGTSGGVWGLDRGYCLMIGGHVEAVQRLDPIFEAIAPGVDGAERTPGRSGEPTPAEQGYLHCGPSGAGHYVKMVHNGIEYGVMAAYAEGFNILRHANKGKRDQVVNAETTPLREPQYYQYDLDMADVAEVWRRGSVIASWLLDLSAIAFLKDPNLDKLEGRVSDSGEGRWTLEAAIDTDAPAHVLAAALFNRFASRGELLFADKVQSAMRLEFGGHEEVEG